MEFLVFWALMGTSVITHKPIIEYKIVEYPRGGCFVDLSRVKLNDKWNATCMTPEQYEKFKKQ